MGGFELHATPNPPMRKHLFYGGSRLTLYMYVLRYVVGNVVIGMRMRLGLDLIINQIECGILANIVHCYAVHH